MSFQPQSRLQSVSFSRDGNLLASAGGDGSLKLWQLDAPNRRWRPGPTLVGGSPTLDDESINSVSFHPTLDNVLLTAGKKGVHLWRYDENGRVWRLDPAFAVRNENVSARQAIFAPDGDRVLIVSDSGATLWDGDRPQLIPNIPDPSCAAFAPTDLSTTATADSPGEHRIRKWIAIGTRSGCVHVRDAENPSIALKPWKGHDLEITSVTFSPDGKRLVTGSRDFTIRVWDITNATMTPAAAIMNCSNDEMRAMLTLEHDRDVMSVSFSPSLPDAEYGPFLLSTGLDGQAFLWPSVSYPSAP
jgi:WD40 repeat protein